MEQTNLTVTYRIQILILQKLLCVIILPPINILFRFVFPYWDLKLKFIQSANRNSNQLAIKCSSYSDYLNGKCARCRREGCRRVGYFLDRQWDDIDQPRKVRKRNHGKYYYQTTSDDDSTSSDDQTIMTCAKGILIALQFRWAKNLIKIIKYF